MLKNINNGKFKKRIQLQKKYVVLLGPYNFKLTESDSIFN